MKLSFSEFLKQESGAVTVDWVVLTAASIGLGIAAAAPVLNGVGGLGTRISNSLISSYYALNPLGRPGVLNQEQLQTRLDTYPTLTTQALANLWRDRSRDFEDAVAAGNNALGNGINNLGAGQLLDILHLQREELLRRGEYPLQGELTYEQAYTLYTNAFGPI